MAVHMFPAFERPWALLLVPLMVLPWVRVACGARRHPWLALLPADGLADALGTTLRALAAAAIAACVLGIAGPFWNAPPVEHVGRGAQIVLVMDRSLSMDQSFGSAGAATTVGVDSLVKRESKGVVARRLLAEFARHRAHDLMAMLVFSTAPIRVTGFTNHQDVIQAAIAAGNVGHGIAETDIGRALIAAVGMFRDQPYNGSRVILLVSDGGARLDISVQQRIADLMKREHVALYWLYLRTTHSPGLLADRTVSAQDQDLVPEHFLHQFFTGMGSPYHAYEAENPDALANAVADVGRLQSLPIRYEFAGVRHDLAPVAFGAALACTLLLTLAGMWEVRP